MNDQIVAFMKRVEEDPEVRREVEAVAAGSRCAGDVTDIAQAHGYDFTLEEFLAATEQVKAALADAEGEGALDDAALDGVSGGGLLGSVAGKMKGLDLSTMHLMGSVLCCGECLEARHA